MFAPLVSRTIWKHVVLPRDREQGEKMSKRKRHNKSESSLLAAACTLDHIFKIFRANRGANSITSWHRMQMYHNMGWDGIKDPSLINDKPGWNPFFHSSAIGKLQAPWKHTHTHTYVCVYMPARSQRQTDRHTHACIHTWQDLSGYFPAWLFHAGREDVSPLHRGSLLLPRRLRYVSPYFRRVILSGGRRWTQAVRWREGRAVSVLWCRALLRQMHGPV